LAPCFGRGFLFLTDYLTKRRYKMNIRKRKLLKLKARMAMKADGVAEEVKAPEPVVEAAVEPEPVQEEPVVEVAVEPEPVVEEAKPKRRRRRASRDSE